MCWKLLLDLFIGLGSKYPILLNDELKVGNKLPSLFPPFYITYILQLGIWMACYFIIIHWIIYHNVGRWIRFQNGWKAGLSLQMFWFTNWYKSSLWKLEIKFLLLNLYINGILWMLAWMALFLTISHWIIFKCAHMPFCIVFLSIYIVIKSKYSCEILSHPHYKMQAICYKDYREQTHNIILYFWCEIDCLILNRFAVNLHCLTMQEA